MQKRLKKLYVNIKNLRKKMLSSIEDIAVYEIRLAKLVVDTFLAMN